MCTGPAEVPMMSPNGSIPPIHVPPGYISQVSAKFQYNIIYLQYKSFVTLLSASFDRVYVK